MSHLSFEIEETQRQDSSCIVRNRAFAEMVARTRKGVYTVIYGLAHHHFMSAAYDKRSDAEWLQQHIQGLGSCRYAEIV